MGLLVFLLITAVILELRYEPRPEKANGDLLIWYNLHRFTKDRDYINVSQLWRDIFNKY